ncbi:hypothetical protein C8E87_5962 [Paractinoplanes brasiliensis]|uniref:Flavin reductase n=1 Tax=Paractinoplanes brasiliensis TaxID=52695 RepID=A0A4R6K3D1_9ACTN|nr:hypothetical protein C8E87_5962 [Actinoplanes brasiliensis]GID31937.1 hypothetical protein Abr02nite_69200 [Actinoplanes brasiliensis]
MRVEWIGGLRRMPDLSQPHMPQRPVWNCHDCGQPWPCKPKVRDLNAEFRDNRTSLVVYLASFFAEAQADLGDDRPVGLYSRFLIAPVVAGRVDRFLQEPELPSF